MNLPTISLITPSYNQAQYLPKTMRSVLNQNYPRLEYFVMDGGSSDNSSQIIEHYAEQLTGWVSQKDSGQADAINQGFARSTGEIMGWLNSDDILFPGALMAIGSYFAAHPEVDVVCGWSLFFREEHPSAGSGISIWYLHEPLGLRLEYLLYSSYFLPQESVFWRRRVYEQIGELDLNCHVLPDHDYFIRMGLIGVQSATIRPPIGCFRQHKEQKTANKGAVRQNQQRIQSHHLENLGVTASQARRRRAYWQRRMIAERALRKLWRLTVERRKVAQVLKESEGYLKSLSNRQSGRNKA